MRDREIDETDRLILESLKGNARQTLSEIGEQVNLSAPAVKRRIDRLEQDGVIIGYTIHVDSGALARNLEAFVEARVSGVSRVEEIVQVASKTPEVEAVYTIAGDPDVLIRLRVEDLDHLRWVVERIRQSGKVSGTKTLTVLGVWRRGRE